MSVLTATADSAQSSAIINEETRADAVLEPFVAEQITNLAMNGILPPENAMFWSFQKWALYLSKLTRSAPAAFYVALGERGQKNLFNHGLLRFYYLLACLQAPTMVEHGLETMNPVMDDVRRFLAGHNLPDEFTLLYEVLCDRGVHNGLSKRGGYFRREACETFDQNKGSYTPAQREVIERMFASTDSQP